MPGYRRSPCPHAPRLLAAVSTLFTLRTPSTRALARPGGGAWRHSLPDALGSVRQWTGPAGAVLGVQSYAPFGEPGDPLSHPQVAAGTPPWGRRSIRQRGVGRAPKGFAGEWQDPRASTNWTLAKRAN